MVQVKNSMLWSTLESRLSGQVHWPDSPGYGPSIARYNLIEPHTPDVVVEALTVGDVQEAVKAAAGAGMTAHVFGAGHGEITVTEGMMISVRAMDGVEIDSVAQTATVGGAARWSDVIAKAAPHGLAPVTGSSSSVGAVGFLTGGGYGPLARSHGAGSDYWLAATVVTGTGSVIRASADEHADLFWALRGGRFGLGVVTEATVRLPAIPSLYAGALIFAEEHIEQVFRSWQAWTETAPDNVTTSVAIANLPAMESIPEPLRGRRLLMLRFAYPGDPVEGARLAEPFRTVAPVYLDQLGPMPLAETARIHSDPPGPASIWLRGALLRNIDDQFCTEILNVVGAGTDSPFVLAEVRHIGDGALQRDVDEGSAVGGRDASYLLMLASANPARFGEAPTISDGVWSAMRGNLNDVNHINFVGTDPDQEELNRCWPAEIRERLGEVRARFDPEGVLRG